MGGFATIFGALIAGAFGLLGEDQQSEDLKRAEGKAEKWANIEREDDLAWKATQEEMETARLKLSGEGLAFQREEAGLGRKERSVQRGLDTRQQGRQNVMNLINTQDSMKNNFLNRMRRAA